MTNILKYYCSVKNRRMKVIVFQGGLGNQIFEYAYYSYLKNKYKNERFFAYYPKSALKRHNGFELSSRFKVEMPPTSLLTNLLGGILFYLNKIFRRLGFLPWFINDDSNRHENALFHDGYMQDRKFVGNNFSLLFKSLELSGKNIELIKRLKSENSVSIHIRRGDYLWQKEAEIFGNICTDEYYKMAIQAVCQTTDNPLFVFFSNDPDYVKKHYKLENMLVVDWNTGDDSFIDMYLMSNCKSMILANSTFSYWAAMLNNNVQTVFCPPKWSNVDNPPEIIMANWIIINCS